MIYNGMLKNGFVDMAIEPGLDLKEEIIAMKRKKKAVILGHYYQIPEIQDISDYLGDSLQLSRAAEKTDAELIVFAGVHFMGETAKILNPEKKVVIPDLNAGCSLAESCPPAEFAAFKDKNPNHIVISYINCSAEIKALSDIICTSSNAVAIVKSIDREQPIIFAPDRNLGRYIMQVCDREMLLWDGYCMVHEVFSAEKIIESKLQHPDALFIAHPECKGPVLSVADFVGSTTALLKFTQNARAKKFIVATESGILHEMKKSSPDKIFIQAPVNEESCGCSDCSYMKLNTIEKLYLCLKYELPEIILPVELMEKAAKPIRRMLELSDKLGIS
jgi:quinolinate synthase